MRSQSIIFFVLFIAAACGGGRSNLECEQNSNCDLATGGLCRDPGTGNRWCAYPDGTCPSGYRYSDVQVGDGVSGQCVAMLDAGVPPDAYLVDARVGDVVANYQAADLVLGQTNYATNDKNHGGASASSLNYPTSVAFDNTGSLWVYDANNSRVLGWSTPPVASFAPASLVVGRTDFVTVAPSPTISSSAFGFDLVAVGHIGVGGGKLLVPSNAFHRILVFNPIPRTSGESAALVLGQVDFTSTKTGDNASDLFIPFGVWTDGNRVAVADAGNNRVLIWTSFPTTNNQPANIVLGQPGFGINTFPNTPTATSMHTPIAVYSDGTRFYVSDSGNSRVLVWNAFPTINGQSADLVLGQTSFSGSASGTSATTLRNPNGIVVAGNNLFVADTGNYRILVYSPIPTTSGAAAKLVLGQLDFTTKGPGTTQNAMAEPEYIAVQGNELYVPDTINNRVLRFGLAL